MVRADGPGARGQASILVRRAPVAAHRPGEGERIGAGPSVGPPADEKGVKRQRAGPVLVVASLGMNAHDHPRAAFEAEREEAVGLDRSRGRLAVPLADGPQLGQPLGTASRRLSQHGVAAMPEREAAVHGLLESDLDRQLDHDERRSPTRAAHSGRLSVGIVKSEANTREVLPPLAGLMVPDRSRMARGSPCRLWST